MEVRKQDKPFQLIRSPLFSDAVRSMGPLPFLFKVLQAARRGRILTTALLLGVYAEVGGRELSIHTGATPDLQGDSGAYRAVKGMWGSCGTRNSEVIPPTIQFHLPWLIGTYPRFQCKLLDVVVLMLSVMMAVAGGKEPQIARPGGDKGFETAHGEGINL